MTKLGSIFKIIVYQHLFEKETANMQIDDASYTFILSLSNSVCVCVCMHTVCDATISYTLFIRTVTGTLQHI